jgi:hypothetical protein
MVVVALAAAPMNPGLVAFTFAGEIASVGLQVSSAFSVGETVTARSTVDSTAASAAVSTLTASVAESPIATNNDDLNHYDRYRAAIAESPPLFNLNAPDVDGVALDSFIVSRFDPSTTAFADTSLPATLDPSYFDSTDTRSAMQFAFDFGSSPNFEAFLVTARSLSLEQEDLVGFEPSSILLFLVGVIGSALTGLALSRRALTGRKRTRPRSEYMTIQVGHVRRIRHGFMYRRSGTWLAAFLSLLAFVYFLFFGLPSARAVTLYTYNFDALTAGTAAITDPPEYSPSSRITNVSVHSLLVRRA